MKLNWKPKMKTPFKDESIPRVEEYQKLFGKVNENMINIRKIDSTIIKSIDKAEIAIHLLKAIRSKQESTINDIQLLISSYYLKIDDKYSHGSKNKYFGDILDLNIQIIIEN